ncbi:Olfactory Receptor 7E24 [Manis pentadactyla]|nr:Olfactory Receptor 7E24 [Manis pentadactyla]
MTCDLFVDICHPLHHAAIMNPCLCSLLVLLSLSISLLDSQLHCLMVLQLTFCTKVDIPQFICDPPQLLKQVCDDISTNNIFICFIVAIFGCVPISGILYSYYKIVSSILKVPSTSGKYKAFSICGSHLSVVCLFYGTDLAENKSIAELPKQRYLSRENFKEKNRFLLEWVRAWVVLPDCPEGKACVSIAFQAGEGLLSHQPLVMPKQRHRAAQCPTYMEPQNLTGVSEFLLLGLSEDPELQPLLFGLFLSLYHFTVLGNLLIILAVSSDPHLHTPMYFFFSSLSLADTGFSTATIPKMLVNIQTHSESISYEGCLTQVSFFFLFACMDNLLLAVMAYDQFVAICHPLHYPGIMRLCLCGLLIMVSFVISLSDSLNHGLMVSQLTFCTHVEIPHFFCMLLSLSASPALTHPVVFQLHGTPVSIIRTILRCPSYMGTKNLTHVTEFLLLVLSDDPELQLLLFGLLLSMYLVTVLGNLLIILAVSSDPHLHTPMYFFLSILSLADIGLTSTTVPKMIVDNQTLSRVISYAGCLTQMSIFIVFACMDSILLTAMAYDRFVAICHPLHYPVIMNPRFCALLVLASFFISLLDSQLHSLMVVQLTFFIDVEIPNFFCGLSPLFNIACFKIPTKTILMCPSSTEPQNLTRVSEFLLLSLSDDREWQPVLFGLLLPMYLVTVLGNLIIILAIGSDPHLHTPMYFYVCKLSFTDLGFTSTTITKMIVDIGTHSGVISYRGCQTQMSFFMFFGCLDSLLLAVMAYDRLVAICHPLHYMAIMNPRLCGLLVLASFFTSLLVSQMHNSIIS